MTQVELSPSMTQVIQERVRSLYQIDRQSGRLDTVLAQAFEELELTLEALRAAEQQLRERDERRSTEHAALEQAYQHYLDLYAHAPAAYLVTGLDGTIRQANAGAEQLLGASERSLLGRSLTNFVPDGQRRSVRGAIAELRGAQEPQTWQLRLLPHDRPAFDVMICVAVARAPSGRPQALRWLLAPAHEPATQPGAADGAKPPAGIAKSYAIDSEVSYTEPKQLFAIMAEATMLLSTSRDMSAMLSQLAQMVVPALADGCIIDLDGSDDGDLRLVVTRPDLPAQVASSAPDRARAGETAGSAQVQWISGGDGLSGAIPRAMVLRTLISALSPHGAIVAPLQENDRVCGSLTLISSSAERAYGPADLALAEELARRASAAVARLRRAG